MSETQKPRSLYAQSGVNIDEQDKAINNIKEIVKSTFTKNVVTGIGSFGAMFSVPEGYKHPILVSSSDGIGTKLKVAFMSGIHNTVGQCLVNHCVDDILVQGATPMYFMDYIATGVLSADTVTEIIKGLSIACKENGVSLIGGEMAEMPGFYQKGEYDVAGFITGILEKENVITGENTTEGDEIWGFESTGLHTNGYSLARNIIFDHLNLKIDSYIDDLGCTVAEELLKIHKSYYPVLKSPIEKGLIRGMAHITGGGFIDNIPRVLPSDVDAVIEKKNVPELPVFKFLVEHGNVPESESYRVFNMGIGMIAIVSPSDRENFLSSLSERPVLLGSIQKGSGIVKMV